LGIMEKWRIKMSEYVMFWLIICIAGFVWSNLVLILLFDWMDRLLSVVKHIKIITKEDE